MATGVLVRVPYVKSPKSREKHDNENSFNTFVRKFWPTTLKWLLLPDLAIKLSKLMMETAIFTGVSLNSGLPCFKNETGLQIQKDEKMNRSRIIQTQEQGVIASNLTSSTDRPTGTFSRASGR